MKFVHDGTKIKDFFCENLKGAISNKYLPISKQPFLKHDLEIQIIDYVYTDGASAMLGNILFC